MTSVLGTVVMVQRGQFHEASITEDDEGSCQLRVNIGGLEVTIKGQLEDRYFYPTNSSFRNVPVAWWWIIRSKKNERTVAIPQ